MPKFKQITEGEWVWPKMRGYKMQCCDCGLIHFVDFVVIDSDGEPVNNYKVILRAYRIERKQRKLF